jgi:PAS domain S-box-containing protein
MLDAQARGDRAAVDVLVEARDDHVGAPRERTLLAAQHWTRLLQARSRASRDGKAGAVQRVRDRPACPRIGVLDENPRLHTSGGCTGARRGRWAIVIREIADATSTPVAEAVTMKDAFKTGDGLFVFDDDLIVRQWNPGAQELTGVAAADAVGRPCWDVLGGHDPDGTLICHAGCSGARLAREGWPVHCRELVVRTQSGGRRVVLSTIAVERDGERQFLHVMHPADEADREQIPDGIDLTARQLEVLELIDAGLATKVIAARLGISVPTVRNHIRAILIEFGAHSQIEALAAARSQGLLGA